MARDADHTLDARQTAAHQATIDIPAFLQNDDVQVLAVAQKRDDGESGRAAHRPTGGTALRLSSPGALGECEVPDPDAGAPPGDAAVPAPDGGVAADAGTMPEDEEEGDDGGCGCRSVTSARGTTWPLALVLGLLLRRSRRRPR